MMKKTCTCDQWPDNWEKLKTLISDAFICTGKFYKGDKLIYCPWCSRKLINKDQYEYDLSIIQNDPELAWLLEDDE